MKWYRLAADQGNASAQINLGLMHAKGEGVPQNYIQAHMWLNLAGARGDEEARKARDIVKDKMTPEQIAEAQRLASVWKPGMVIDAPAQMSELPSDGDALQQWDDDGNGRITCAEARRHGLAPGCLRCLLLVMYMHPFSKEALTLHLARSEGHERYFGCNLMHRRVLVSSHQHLMAEAPEILPCDRREPLRRKGQHVIGQGADGVTVEPRHLETQEADRAQTSGDVLSDDRSPEVFLEILHEAAHRRVGGAARAPRDDVAHVAPGRGVVLRVCRRRGEQGEGENGSHWLRDCTKFERCS